MDHGTRIWYHIPAHFSGVNVIITDLPKREREPEIEICRTHPVIFDGYKLLRLPLRSNMKTP